ncbi:MAG TPA: flagellar hook-basal body complex protein FliE [Firmicutes bacterium]|nr:flagellar hook-basal body complex protein FliE [Candidatus Fermentithermobacillaceae bacterium]
MSIRFVPFPVTGPSRPSTVHNRNISSSPNTSFNHLFAQASSVMENLDQELMASQIDLATGNARDMHTAVLAAEKASLTLDLVISVRNKAIEAYQEIMRMPL